MTQEVVEAPAPPRGLYHSPRGLYDFQAEDIAKAYVKGSGMVAWDTGTGKSHMAMALGCLLVEDDLIDHVVLICEKNKISDWVDDFGKFTDLHAAPHYGTLAARMKRLEAGVPQVLVSTYETAKADLVVQDKIKGKRGTNFRPGRLMEAIGDKRVLVVYDESTKVKNRKSGNYRAQEFLLRGLRKAHPDTRVWGLTATPIERDWEDAFNQFRLLVPWAMPTVKEFEERFVAGRDPYDRPRYREDKMHEFAAMCQPWILRRRKTDPELIDEFPRQVEEAHHIQMGDLQRKFYELVEEIGWPEDQDEPEPGLWTVLRQVAGHPASLVRGVENGSGGVLGRILVEELGADYLSSIPSAKTDWLVNDYLPPLVKGQGAKAVVFTFFGQTVLPIIGDTLESKGFRVFRNHGGMTERDQVRERNHFKELDEPAIYLTSDAGARGINLPQAAYVVEYESALTYANRTQRINRIHRIDSEFALCTCMTAILSGTVEDKIAAGMITRNEQTDTLLGDDDAGENFMSAADRKIALRIARTNRKARR